MSFFWTLHLFPEWLLTNGLILLIFWMVDSYQYRREPCAALALDAAEYVPLRLVGGLNILLLVGVIVTVALSGPIARVGSAIHFPLLRDALLIALILVSVHFGPAEPRRLNRFTWGPITEVAIIFAGIFATMIPALDILEANADKIGLTAPWQFFWATGSLSAFLDNAPTYLTFSALAQGITDVASTGDLMIPDVLPGLGVAPSQLLAAISCGAVFMGAFSYIGNAPNFMIKSIAEEHGVRMPNFFHYMGIAAVVLLPIFVLVTVLFFV